MPMRSAYSSPRAVAADTRSISKARGALVVCHGGGPDWLRGRLFHMLQLNVVHKWRVGLSFCRRITHQITVSIGLLQQDVSPSIQLARLHLSYRLFPAGSSCEFLLPSQCLVERSSSDGFELLQRLQFL